MPIVVRCFLGLITSATVVMFYGNMVLASIYTGDEDSETLFGMKLRSIQRSLASQVLTMSASAVWTTFRDKEGVYLCYPKAKMRIDSIDPDGNHRQSQPSGASNHGGTSGLQRVEASMMSTRN